MIGPTMRSRDLAAPAWALVSFGLFVAASFGALVVDAAVNVVVELPHLVTMAEWSLVWGGLGIAGVLVAGRLVFGTWLPVDRAGLALAGIGIGLSAVVHVVLQQWAGDRFGYYDPDMVGLTAGQFAVLNGLAVSAFGVFVAPRGAAGWPLAAVVAGTASILLVLVVNLPGIRDGIRPDAWPLAFWLGASGFYAVSAMVACVARVRAAPGTPPRGLTGTE